MFARSGRTKPLIALFLPVSVTSSLLLIGWIMANHFTGEGINAATLFHVYYGFAGAGLRDYERPIALCGAAILAVPLLLTAAACWKRDRPRRGGYLAAAYILAIASLASNPAVADLIGLARRPPVQTADFLRHYRTPTIKPIANEHPNFVFIYAESLERTYFDERIFPGLITELRSLETRATSFTNILSLYGTGFTMGGLVASQCGIPLFTPAHPNSMSGMDSFLPGAVGLGDLLHEQGYYLSFWGGAPRGFGGKDKFLTSHHFDEVIGFSELHPKIPDRTYISNWGIYDDDLFNLVFERFTELAEQKKHFGLFLLTLDTHSPDGHRSKTVAASSYGDGSNPILNAVKGSDRLLGEFVRRLQASPYGKNTVIVIASDHVSMPNAASALLARGERRNLFLVLDPRQPTGRTVNRLGSTLDTGSTLLPFLGFKGRIGLGRDLLDPTVDDAEIAHIHDTQVLLSWSAEIEKFWEFPRFEKMILFNSSPPEVTIDGRRFRAPLLMELNAKSQTTLRFEFDATWDVRLADQARKLAKGTKFLLIAQRDDLKTAFANAVAGKADAWQMIVGRAGMGEVALPLPTGAEFSRKQIDAFLAKWGRRSK